MSASEFDIVRRAYAWQMVGLLGLVRERLENAFAAVPREHFLGPEPWHVRHGQLGYVELPTNDPVYAYQDVLFALKQERGVNNGSPSLHARMMHALDPAVGSTIAHIGAGAGYYSAILARTDRSFRQGDRRRIRSGFGRAGTGQPHAVAERRGRPGRWRCLATQRGRWCLRELRRRTAGRSVDRAPAPERASGFPDRRCGAAEIAPADRATPCAAGSCSW